jgi:uncharacterized Zn finger protein (UPF0148 family)
MSVYAHRYATDTVDDEGVTIMLDLCHKCAKVLSDLNQIDGRVYCPTVDYHEGYQCDRCDRRIALS